MSRRHFSNTMPDYTEDLAKDVMEKHQIHPQHFIMNKMNEKWCWVEEKFKYTDRKDFTVYTGTAGLALLKLKHDPENFENLREIIQLLHLDRIYPKVPTFLCGDAGPLAIGAVVYDMLHNKDESTKCIEKLLSMESQIFDTGSSLPSELLYGRTGYLYAVMFVKKRVSTPLIDDDFIGKIIEAILICGQNEAKAGKFKCPLMYQWHDTHYLGSAHGVTGVLYLLLQLKDYLKEKDIQKLIKPTIDYLSTLRFPSGNYPSSMGKEEDNLVQWCHGAPGFVYLYSQAYKTFGDAKYLQLALDAGDVVWKRGLLRKGYSLCHGVTGNGYCFLELFQTTQDDKHLYRAIKFAEWSFYGDKKHEEYPPDRPVSLFEGFSGPMYYYFEFRDVMNAKFPGFTL